jgi:hypothetical protein
MEKVLQESGRGRGVGVETEVREGSCGTRNTYCGRCHETKQPKLTGFEYKGAPKVGAN